MAKNNQDIDSNPNDPASPQLSSESFEKGHASSVKIETESSEIKGIEESVLRKTNGVFYYHGKNLIYSKMSLYCLDDDSEIRQAMVWLVSW